MFLLGRVGDNKRALNLIISRLQDVPLAIEFAKEQNDDDLWEDLLRYSETRPEFIKGLLENVGAEIDPIRLIRRIRDGLEIPGLKDALIKTLSDFNLQISLLEGCVGILESDVSRLAQQRLKGQTRAKFFDVSSALHHHLQSSGDAVAEDSVCPACQMELWKRPKDTYEATRREYDLSLPRAVFLCGHAYHLVCALGASGKTTQQVIDSLPSWLKKHQEQAAADELPSTLTTTTTTQRASLSRLATDSPMTKQQEIQEYYGPAVRAMQYRRDLQNRLALNSKLRSLVKAQGGCAHCRTARGAVKAVG